MYDKNLIIANFMGSSPLVGLRQNDNPDFPQLAPSLLYDGNNIQVKHSLINIENIDMCARNYDKFNFPAYNPATPYTIGQRVKFNNVSYEAIAASTGVQPDTDPATWEVLNLLSLFLIDVFANGIEETVRQVFQKKKLAAQTKTVLATMKPFDAPGGYTDLIMNEGDMVGVYIELKYRQNIVAIIEKIGFQVSQANATLTFLVYHTSQVEGPIATVVFNHTKLFSFQWHDTKKAIMLNSSSEVYSSGGGFFIMYDQSKLIGQAVKKIYNFNIAPCSYCDVSLVSRFNMYSRYLSMKSVRVKAINRKPGINPGDPDQLWDLSKTESVPDNNWGLNFEFSVRCDLTNFLIQQRDVFGYAVRDMVIKNILDEMKNSTRQNHGQEKLNQLARMELMSPSAGGMGFDKKVQDSLDEVDFEISNLDATCMPCNNKTGLRGGSFGLNR